MKSPIETIECIKHAAVMTDQGWIFMGKSHAQCFDQMRNISIPIPQGSMNQGFVTSHGRFVSRERAMDIALKSEQVSYNANFLISEMLWSERDAGKFDYDSIKGYIEKNQSYKHGPDCSEWCSCNQ